MTLSYLTARLGAWLIDLTGRRAALLHPETAGLLLTPAGFRAVLPEPGQDGNSAALANGFLAMTLTVLLRDAGQNPSLFDAMLTAGVELGLPMGDVHREACAFCGLDALAGPLLDDGGVVAGAGEGLG